MDPVNLKIENNELILINKKRFYLENLKDRDYLLENTTPYLLVIDDYEINETTWGNLVANLATLLIDKYFFQNSSLFDFKTAWSKQDVFSNIPRTNFRKVAEFIYINCGHTALHSCWLIQDLLSLFNVELNRVKLYIHRPSAMEPQCVKKYFLGKTYKEFKFFLQQMHEKTLDQSDRIISNINNYLNPILKSCSKSYDDLFLFDDYAIFYNYILYVRKQVDIRYMRNNKVKSSLNRYCDYLINFFKLY